MLAYSFPMQELAVREIDLLRQQLRDQREQLAKCEKEAENQLLVFASGNNCGRGDL